MQEQFEYTFKDIEAIKHSYTTPYGGGFIITQWPSKLKKRVCLVYLISDFFSMDVPYSEADVNEILKPIYDDHVMLRRFLIDLQLMTRDDYGKVYHRTKKRIQIIDEKNM